MKKIITTLCFCVLYGISLKAQILINGTVTSSEDGAGLPGVNITIKGTYKGTITDFEGKYTLDAPHNTTLNFSYVGFVDQQVKVENTSIIDVVLIPDIQKLDEVVVTSLGLARKKMALNYSVSEVSGEDFTEARENNLADALSGKVAGVNVSNIATGAAGASRVIIRGNASLTQNNQPLYVVDGVPIDNTTFTQAGMWGGPDWGDGTISINPDDIETMSVLKGANASALYGSRASNGVILITTKRGDKRKGLGIEFNSNFVMEKVIDYSDPQTAYGHGNLGVKPETILTGYEYTQKAWGALLDSSMSYTFDGVERPYVNTFADGGNNIKKFYRTGNTWTNSLAVSGGSEKHTARFSLSHLRNTHPVPNSGFERMNAGVNYNGKWGKFEMDTKLYYSKEKVQNRPWVSDITGNANSTVFQLPSSIDVRTLKGDPEKLGATYKGQTNPDPNKRMGDELSPNRPNRWLTNPYWAAYQFVTDNTRDRVIGHVRARYNITDYLYAQVRIGIDWYYSKFLYINAPYGTAYDPGGKMTESSAQAQEVNSEWTVGFNEMWNNFGINAFIGGNAMTWHLEGLFLNAANFNIPGFHTISNGADQSQHYSYEAKGINSLYGSLELSWGGYLYLTATARNDWFSTLPPDSNSILYPSIGLSWIFSDMFNMPAWWNVGKFRASWAQVGGDTNPFNLYQTYQLISYGHLGQATGEIAQNINPNPNLVPLTSTETELGLDLRLFNNRLGLDVALYSQKTTDDIVPATITNATGYTAAWINVGEIQNKGYEILLTGNPVRGTFSWDIQVNYAENHSEVVKISDEMDKYIPEYSESRTRTAFIEHWEGESYGTIVGYRQKTVDGNKVINPTTGYPVRDNTKVILGYGVQPYTGGITNTLSYKGFNLSFLIDCQFGGHIHSGTNDRMVRNGLHKLTLEGREDGLISTGVNESGQEISVTIPKENLQYYWREYAQITDYFIYNASFVRLRQVTFGYMFPGQWLKNTPFSYLSLSFVGRNLALLYSNTENVDPESTYNNTNAQGLEFFGVPPTRSYGFNLSVKF